MKAIEELIKACELEFTSEETANEPDAEAVVYPNSHITFGHIRRARQEWRDLSLSKPQTETPQ